MQSYRSDARIKRLLDECQENTELPPYVREKAQQYSTAESLAEGKDGQAEERKAPPIYGKAQALALEQAEKYERLGDEQRARYWLEKAVTYESRLGRPADRLRETQSRLEEFVERRDLFPSERNRERELLVQDLRALGRQGSVAVEEILRELIACRSAAALEVLDIAEHVEATRSLVEVVDSYISAPAVAPLSPTARFTAEICDHISVGWLDSTASRIRQKAKDTRAALLRSVSWGPLP